MQWLLGNWAEISKRPGDALRESGAEGDVAAILAAACLQSGETSKVEAMIAHARRHGSEVFLREVLVAGIHNILGRARALLGDRDRAMAHFAHSVSTDGASADPAVALARAAEQLRQMGIEPFVTLADERSWPVSAAADVIEKLGRTRPRDRGLLIALAESCQARGDYGSAVRHWQAVAALLQEAMPSVYYERLAEAYAKVGKFPAGSSEEESLRGAGDKYALLEEIHRILKPGLYLEIGVQGGNSLRISRSRSIGVDPMLKAGLEPADGWTLLRMTSDDFFARAAERYLAEPPGLVFIDGMHLFEYALRDFMNVEAYSSERTVVVIDDIFPGHVAQAERDRRTRAWTGDVWKLVKILEEHRPDLSIEKIDVYPTGVMVISGLDYRNVILSRSYDRIVAEWESAGLPDRRIVERSGAVDPEDYFKRLRSKEGL